MKSKTEPTEKNNLHPRNPHRFRYDFDKLIEVYPFWGNESLCEIGITRTDFDLSERGVNIKPTAYLIGGVFSDSAKNSVNKNCTPRRKMGRKCDLVTKSANIEALRFKPIKDDLGRPFLEYLSIDEDIPDDGGFVLPLSNFIKTGRFELNEAEQTLILVGIACSVFYDNSRVLKLIYKKIKEHGLEETFKEVLIKSKNLKNSFSNLKLPIFSIYQIRENNYK